MFAMLNDLKKKKKMKKKKNTITFEWQINPSM